MNTLEESVIKLWNEVHSIVYISNKLGIEDDIVEMIIDSYGSKDNREL